MGVFFFSMWEYFGKNSNITKLLVSTPSLTFGYFINNYTPLLQAFKVTFIESITGLILAMLFSFFVMTIGFYNKRFLDILMPIFLVSQVIPIITLAPLIILLFGIGIKAKIIISALMCFFPILINFNNGIRNIPIEILETLKVYNATNRFKIRNIYFPLSAPNIMTGLKISSVLSVIGAIVGEFNGADIGLGKNLFLSAKRIEPELMICSLFLSSLLGIILYGLIILIENKICKWYLKNSIQIN